MKLSISFSSLVLISALSLSNFCGAQSADAPQQPPLQTGPKTVNRLAASVNGRPITTNEVSIMLMPVAAQLAAQFPRQGDEFHKQLIKAKNQILDELINRELVLAEFNEKGFQFPDSYIDQEVERTIMTRFNGNRDVFLDNLKKSGMTIRAFREMTRQQLIVGSMRAQKYDTDIPPTPDEVQKEYNRTKDLFRDLTKDKITFEKIFLPMPPTRAEQEEQLALGELIVEQINGKKETFENLAKSYSKDAQAENGGQWPEVERGDLSAELAAIIFEAPVGKIIGPLADPSGFTIIRTKSKKLAPAPPLSKIKEMVEDQVRRTKSAARYDKWIERLREKALIKKHI